MRVQIRNVQIKNKPLFWLGCILLGMALLVLLLPEPVIAQIKYWGSGFGKWWSYLVEFAFPLLLAVAFFIIDKATAGTWWAKRVGE